MLPTFTSLSTLVLAIVALGGQVVMSSHLQQGAGFKRHARHASLARRHAREDAHHHDTEAHLTKRGKTPSTEVFTGCACSMQFEMLAQTFSSCLCARRDATFYYDADGGTGPCGPSVGEHVKRFAESSGYGKCEGSVPKAILKTIEQYGTNQIVAANYKNGGFK